QRGKKIGQKRIMERREDQERARRKKKRAVSHRRCHREMNRPIAPDGRGHRVNGAVRVAANDLRKKKTQVDKKKAEPPTRHGRSGESSPLIGHCRGSSRVEGYRYSGGMVRSSGSPSGRQPSSTTAFRSYSK